MRRLRPWESGGHRVRGGAGKRAPGLPTRAEGMLGHKKQPPAEAGDCVQTAPWGSGGQWEVSGAGKGPEAVCRLRPWESGRQWVPGRHRTGRPPEQRAYPAQKQPPAEAGDCAQAAPWGERQAMRVSGAGKAPHWAPGGTGARPGAKTAPGGAGGCLDAGYGCYLPRAIRVIWMHRVGSTARPRIMPS